MIDSNEIFVDGDKDVFLNRFVEPYLKSGNSRIMQEVSSSKSYSLSVFKQNPEPANGHVEIFHFFSKIKQKAIAAFDPSSKKIIYNDEYNLSPSGAAILHLSAVVSACLLRFSLCFIFLALVFQLSICTKPTNRYCQPIANASTLAYIQFLKSSNLKYDKIYIVIISICFLFACNILTDKY